MKQLKTTITLSLLLFISTYTNVNGQSDAQILKAMPHMIEGYKTQGAQADFTIGHIMLADLKEMDRRKYVVLQSEPDADVMKELSGSLDLLNVYKAGIDGINGNLKLVMTKFWKICPDSSIIYLTTRQFNTIADKENYMIVFCYASSCYSSVMSYRLPLFKSNIKYSEKRMKEYINNKNDIENQVFFALEKPEDNTIVYSRAMPDMFPTKADLVMAVTDVSTKYSVYKTFLPSDLKDMGSKECWLDIAHKDFAVDLAGKTLLIKKDWIGSTKLTESDIKKLYPYSFKLVTSDELDQYIMNQTPGYLFLYPDIDAKIFNGDRMTSSLGLYVNKCIVDIADFNTLTSARENYNVLTLYLRKEDIKKWVEDSHQKINIVPDTKKYPDYAGFLIPLKFFPKENAPNNTFCLKNTPLDSCLITIGNGAVNMKFLNKYYNSPSASWDGKVNGQYDYEDYYQVIIKGISGKDIYYQMKQDMYMAR